MGVSGMLGCLSNALSGGCSVWGASDIALSFPASSFISSDWFVAFKAGLSSVSSAIVWLIIERKWI